ncbi:MAG: 5'-methylthioadenosine/adenosylhomocysteine nucleosidase [Oscillospiraceae bacterium]|jgi:adenosylhomocysteine nucleosidase|nr:5'-methylthioadenosine/adenosylhomocysteine nucleosidase [Oscillospiraceae bacterium]
MTGIICALNIEVDGLIAKMQNPQTQTFAKMNYTSGTIGDAEVVAVECGIGKVNAAMCAQIMIDRYSPDVIINSGVAGGLSQNVDVYDIVIAKDVVQHDMDTTAIDDPRGAISFNDEKRTFIPTDGGVAKKLTEVCRHMDDTKVFYGRIATGDVFVQEKAHRRSIGEEFSADACEMEGGAIGQVCYRNGVPFGILRCISDSINNNDAEDFIIFKDKAAAKSIKIILDFLKKN